MTFQEETDLSYEDVLAMRAPLSTSNIDINHNGESDNAGEISDQPTQETREQNPNDRQNSPVPETGAIPYWPDRDREKRAMKLYNKIRTPKLPAEVKSMITPQCTMPSYAVMKVRSSGGDNQESERRGQSSNNEKTSKTEVSALLRIKRV